MARVDNIWPRNGSLEGGNTIYITGHGFEVEPKNNKVFIGNRECKVT